MTGTLNPTSWQPWKCVLLFRECLFELCADRFRLLGGSAVLYLGNCWHALWEVFDCISWGIDFHFAKCWFALVFGECWFLLQIGKCFCTSGNMHIWECIFMLFLHFGECFLALQEAPLQIWKLVLIWTLASKCLFAIMKCWLTLWEVLICTLGSADLHFRKSWFALQEVLICTSRFAHRKICTTGSSNFVCRNCF